MIIKIVDVWVKSEYILDYVKLTESKTKGARSEPGITMFEVYQDKTFSNHFIHYEIFLDSLSEQAHKNSDHYRIWRDSVEHMMAEPRAHVYADKVYP